MAFRTSGKLLLHKTKGTSWKMPFSSAELDGIFTAMLDASGRPDACVELTLLDDGAMSELHASALGCKGPTNVLSFPASGASGHPFNKDRTPAPEDNHAESGSLPLGWLALSVDTLLRESYLYGQTVEEHCLRLLAHGMAHILGHDHGPDMDAICDLLEKAAERAAPTP